MGTLGDARAGRKFKSSERSSLIQCNDRLGKNVTDNLRLFHECKSHWLDYVRQFRTRSHLHHDIASIKHPAARFLDHLRKHGAPIRMADDNWSPERIADAATRGPHQSTEAHVAFVREEMADFDDKSFWTVLPLEAVRHLPNLRLSPLGCVPQRDRRPRLINDLTFYGINNQTIRMAPSEAMQFGKALERILHKIQHADLRHGPVYLCKIDIADGFYRIDLEAATAPSLAVILPHSHDEQPLVAIPLSLPMGWVESAPYFCSATETIADLANNNIHQSSTPHQLDALADTEAAIDPTPQQLAIDLLPSLAPPPPPHPDMNPSKPRLAYIDLYMDDFLGLCQGNRRTRNRVRRILLHAIDAVLTPLDPTLHPQHNEPTSVKKLLKGDGNWSTTKTMLGWLINTVDRTLTLPPHRVERLLAIFTSLHNKKRASTRIWHRTIGELRSMVMAIQGG